MRNIQKRNLFFINKASEENSPIYFAEDFYVVNESKVNKGLLELKILDKTTNTTQILNSQLTGSYQIKNILGVS